MKEKRGRGKIQSALTHFGTGAAGIISISLITTLFHALLPGSGYSVVPKSIKTTAAEQGKHPPGDAHLWEQLGRDQNKERDRNGFGVGFARTFSFFIFFLETNQAQMMEEKPGPGLQSGRATDALIRVGTIKQPVCSLGSTLSPANYLPAAQKLSVLQIFSKIRKK